MHIAYFIFKLSEIIELLTDTKKNLLLKFSICKNKRPTWNVIWLSILIRDVSRCFHPRYIVVKRSFRSRITDSTCVQGRDLVQILEVTHSSATRAKTSSRGTRLSSYTLPSVGLSGSTENRLSARNQRYLIQKTVRLPYLCLSEGSATCCLRTNFWKSKYAFLDSRPSDYLVINFLMKSQKARHT